MQKEYILSGFGGQGLMLAGVLLSEAGILDGKNVSWIPSYGPEMRGGTANCAVVVSEEPIGSPIVDNPDVVIAMNLPSMDKFEPLIKKGGLMVFNSSLIKSTPKRDDLTYVAVPANEIAESLGSEKVANMVMLGAMLKADGWVSTSSLGKVIEKKMTGSKAKFIPLNIAAIKKGEEIAG
ncbi:MAG TPA: 2-oxoacid:acceptor oxidoreductase family protein [Bacillota bacterium]|nr:2-oxoacid:acceptor oxidoreductase family protein [Bacillota bacterium]